MTFMEKIKRALRWATTIFIILILGFLYVKFLGKASVEKATSMFKDADINSNIKIEERREVCVATRKCHDVAVLKYFDHILIMSDNGDMVLVK